MLSIATFRAARIFITSVGCALKSVLLISKAFLSWSTIRFDSYARSELGEMAMGAQQSACISILKLREFSHHRKCNAASQRIHRKEGILW